MVDDPAVRELVRLRGEFHLFARGGSSSAPEEGIGLNVRPVTGDTAKRRFMAECGILLLLALCVRVAAVLIYRHAPLPFDGASYDRIGWSLASGHGYPPAAAGVPSAFRPPGNPYFLAGVYAVAGHSLLAARLALAVSGVISVALIGVIARQCWGRRVTLWAMAIAAIYVPFVLSPVSLLSEPLFIVAALGSLAAALRFRESNRLRWAMVAGAAAGIAWLTRTTAPALFIPLVLLVWRRRPRWSRAGLAAPLALLAALVLAVLPWTVRNLVVTHALLPISDEAGYTLAGTYNETVRSGDGRPTFDHHSYQGLWEPAQFDPHNAQLMRSGHPNEVEMSSRLLSSALRFAEHHPGYVAAVGVANTLTMLQFDRLQFMRWDFTSSTGASSRVSYVALASFYVLALLSLVAVFTRAAGGAPWELWLAAVLLVVIVAFVIAGPWYRLPVDSFLILLAASAVARLRVGTPIMARHRALRETRAGVPSR